MDADKVIQDLNRRFAAPLPEFYLRRIIFWQDEDREFEDKLDEIELDGVTIVRLTGNNTFAVKRLIHDDRTSNLLIYNPLSFDMPDDDWLMDVKLYSEEFRADLISIWMDELGMDSTPAMRRQVKVYRKFLGAQARREKIKAQGKAPATPRQFDLAVMGAICGLKTVTPNLILRTILKACLDNRENAFYQDLVTYGAYDTFWAMVLQGTGYSEEEPTLGNLAIHMLLTAVTRSMEATVLKGLERFISPSHQAYCYDFISDWLHSGESDSLYDIARFVEEELRLARRFGDSDISKILDTECLPCINEVILSKIMTDISNHLIDVAQITTILEKRRTFAWYDEYKNYFEGIGFVAKMQSFYLEHSDGFHLTSAKDIWDAYTCDYYRMDAYYRGFQLSYQRTLLRSNPELDDLFKSVVDIVEGLYTNWFLGELGENWSNISCDDLATYGRVQGVAEQAAFYNKRIRYADARYFVIISDALRYEVAATLAEELQKDTTCQVKLDSMQGIFPTITKFGMAALLPHDELTVIERGGSLAVLADGMSTESNNREMVLKNAEPNSRVLQYRDFIQMRRVERQELVRGMDVVYIYHNEIDDAAHASETDVFFACEDAIGQIKNLVHILTSDFGGAKILITADHGFLYTGSPLTESDKIGRSEFGGREVENGRRYAVVKNGVEPNFLAPVKLPYAEGAYIGLAPKENIRIKMHGGGLNFVHGGISLQEMVVPVIEYHHLRSTSAEYQRNRQKFDTRAVEISLLSATRKISNMIFSLNFYQKEAVGGPCTAATYVAYFEDKEGRVISDTKKIVADKTGSDTTERTFRCTFNLKSLQYRREETYFLIIQEEGGLMAPQRIEYQIDIAFAVEDGGFFD